MSRPVRGLVSPLVTGCATRWATAIAIAIASAAALVPSVAAAIPASAPASASAPAPAASGLAIVVRDSTPLRAGPRESAQQQALLWQGELLELRGERIDALQVWNHRLERGGYVEATRVRRLATDASAAPDLLAVLRFVRETNGSEALGIGLAAAYLKAASADALDRGGAAEAFDAIGGMAERLALRASAGPSAPIVPGAAPSRADVALSAHLELVGQYGVAFRSIETEGAVRICYDGDAFRRVLALRGAEPAQRARAALGLTRPECIEPNTTVTERQRLDAWRAEVLDRADAAAVPAALRNRLAMRRAGVWAGLAYQQARRGEASAEASARRAVSELADVARADLSDDDQAAYSEAAMRVGASRLAAAPAGAVGGRLALAVAPGDAGQSCVALVDSSKPAASAMLARRCTYGLVWPGSATLSREGNAMAVAVQPMEAWRELWLFVRQPNGTWAVQVLPPSTATPGLGYVEFAGWVPGGKQVLVAREARGERGTKRSFDVVRIETLAAERQSPDPSALGPFQRWQDPAWKRETVSLR